MHAKRDTIIRKVFTPDELERANQLWMVLEEIEKSFDLFYIQRLHSTLISKHLGQRREWSAMMSAGFTATLISYRKLNEFFSEPSPKRRKKHPDDIWAINFGFRNSRPPLAQADSDELSKFTAHLTKAGESLRMRGFHIGRLGNAIYSRCLEFFEHLENGRLDRRVLADRQMRARLNSIRRQIAAVTDHPVRLHR
jgi:hypothetical protein